MTLPVRCSCAAAGPGFSIPLIPCKPPVSQSPGSLFLLFSPAVFSPCCEAVCHFFSALYFFRALLPAARFPRGNPAYVFPIEAKRSSAPPLPASPRLFFFLSPQSRPVRCHILSVFLLPLPARSSAFRLNAILSVVTFPLHVTFPCSRFRLSPQSRPSVVTSLFPLAFPACAFLFPNPVFTAGKRQQKKPFPYGKGFLPSAFPDPTNKKTFSERTLKRFPFKMDQTNSMMTRRAASPLRGSSFMIRV